MEIRQAKLDEVNTVQSLLHETAEWLQSIGSSQWKEILAGDDKHGLSQAVEKGEVYFFYSEKNELIGMAAAWKKPSDWDQLLWKEIGFSENSYYIHRVIIRPQYRKMHYGDQLLTTLKLYFQSKASELRLDCLASNKHLLNFYSKNNFNKVGTQKDLNGISFELFSYMFNK
ncbi:GNAT family N-acetyltransferase [Enterococcus sp. LJL99]